MEQNFAGPIHTMAFNQDGTQLAVAFGTSIVALVHHDQDNFGKYIMLIISREFGNDLVSEAGPEPTDEICIGLTPEEQSPIQNLHYLVGQDLIAISCLLPGFGIM